MNKLLTNVGFCSFFFFLLRCVGFLHLCYLNKLTSLYLGLSVKKM